MLLEELKKISTLKKDGYITSLEAIEEIKKKYSSEVCKRFENTGKGLTAEERRKIERFEKTLARAAEIFAD